MIGAWIALGWCSLLYGLPWLVAECRQHRQGGLIMAVNLLTGWTGIGWIIAMTWAMDDDALSLAALGPTIRRPAAYRAGRGAW